MLSVHNHRKRHQLLNSDTQHFHISGVSFWRREENIMRGGGGVAVVMKATISLTGMLMLMSNSWVLPWQPGSSIDGTRPRLCYRVSRLLHTHSHAAASWCFILSDVVFSSKTAYLEATGVVCSLWYHVGLGGNWWMAVALILHKVCNVRCILVAHKFSISFLCYWTPGTFKCLASAQTVWAESAASLLLFPSPVEARPCRFWIDVCTERHKRPCDSIQVSD